MNWQIFYARAKQGQSELQGRPNHIVTPQFWQSQRSASAARWAPRQRRHRV